MKKFTEDEKIIARNIDIKYKWITRNSYGNIYVHQTKPVKSNTSWIEPFSRSGEFFAFNYVFKSIKWEDNEPTRISDIYNPQILDDVEREYLKAVLKPFHEEVDYVKKRVKPLIDGWRYSKEYLFVSMCDCDGGLMFPSFDSGKMYSGMELDKRYKLNELGIAYDD